MITVILAYPTWIRESDFPITIIGRPSFGPKISKLFHYDILLVYAEHPNVLQHVWSHSILQPVKKKSIEIVNT